MEPDWLCSSLPFGFISSVQGVGFAPVLCQGWVGKYPDGGVLWFLFIGVSASQQPLFPHGSPQGGGQQRPRGWQGLRRML